ncbi:zf-HC2 domain-containing protein [Desulfotruncus alcoholivorax]|uniref:zf-HC2 domain-containing protein n=1 Tax=Desulfotruncus alcoholivorax TaxID=265477 RepID=UPI001EE5E333|nr:zf-HC2 domain-containing protein [Desulfotruncus alcoholivorax]
MQIQQLIPEWLDGELDTGTAGQIEKHVTTCDECNAEAAFWRETGNALREGVPSVKAPPGFAGVVMSQLPSQRRTITARLFTGWKRNFAAAAAFMIVALGSAGAYMYWDGNVAGQLLSNGKTNPVRMIYNKIQSNIGQDVTANTPRDNVTGEHAGPAVQPGDTNADPGKAQHDASNNNHMNNNEPGAHQGEAQNSQATPDTESESVSKPAVKGADPQQYVLLSTDKNRVLDRTFLKVKVDDLQAAHRQALALINSSGASYEVFGSEYTPAGNQETLKIVTGNSISVSLLDNLKKLGQVLNSDTQRIDINARYKEKVEQYQSLSAQLENSGPVEQEQLKIKMAGIEAQLKDWDQEANTDTIILWLDN